MRQWPLMMLIGLGGTVLGIASAQQPPQKGPVFPPINPAVARLDFMIADLDGPGFGIVHGSETNLLVVACENGTLQAFKKDALEAIKSGTAKAETWKGHEGPIRLVVWNGGPVLVSVGSDKKVNFWKAPEGKVIQGHAADHRIRAAALSQDGKLLATGGESESIQLWDVASSKPTTKLTDKMDWTLALAFSADSKQLLSADYLGVVRLWDVAAGKKIAELPAKAPEKKPPPDPVTATAVAFAPDGKTCVIGNAEGNLQLVQLGDGKIVRTFTGHTGPITGIAFHPSGTLMATCSRDRTIKLWNPVAPQPAVQPLKSLDGHTAWIEGIVFFDQATKLASAGADQTLRIWDLTDPPKKK